MSEISQELVERVERAAGPDRELDVSIWLAVTPGATRSETIIPANAVRRGWTIDETREHGRLIVVPNYTSSLDDANSLRPVCSWGDIGTDANGRGRAELWGNGWFYGSAASAPLALTAASLRARMVQS